tara:strand:- start:1138 stop:1839 length:702 start_codon:yes stop_codon:yes gene_type:complete
MKVNAFPEIFNTFSKTNISNTKKAILNNLILQKYSVEMLTNKDGCIFKLKHLDLENGLCLEDYVSCGDFTAPNGIIYLPNNIFENLLLDTDSKNRIEIELFNPPQATSIKLRPNTNEFDMNIIKHQLETEIKNNHMFLKLDDVITIDNNYFIVSKLEPYDICMVNNTDLEVEFDKIDIIDPIMDDIKYEDDNERVNIVFNETDKNLISNIEKLNIEKPDIKELREKRIAFFSK